MEETLADALAALFRQSSGPRTAEAPAGAASAAVERDRARTALGHYNRALERLKAGDWGAFGAELDELRAALEALERPGGQ